MFKKNVFNKYNHIIFSIKNNCRDIYVYKQFKIYMKLLCLSKFENLK